MNLDLIEINCETIQKKNTTSYCVKWAKSTIQSVPSVSRFLRSKARSREASSRFLAPQTQRFSPSTINQLNEIIKSRWKWCVALSGDHFRAQLATMSGNSSSMRFKLQPRTTRDLRHLGRHLRRIIDSVFRGLTEKLTIRNGVPS